MRHARKDSDFDEPYYRDAYPTESDARSDEDDEPIAIHSGISMPVWKTPNAPSAHSRKSDSSGTLFSGISDPTDRPIDLSLSDLDLVDSPEDSDTSGEVHATILSEKPIKLSLWRKFKGIVGRYVPGFSDESSLLRLNLYLGGALLVVAVTIVILVLIINPGA